MKKPVDMVVLVILVAFVIIIMALPDRQKVPEVTVNLPTYQPPAHITCYANGKKILDQDVIRWRVETLSIYIDNGDRYFNFPCIITGPKVLMSPAQLPLSRPPQSPERSTSERKPSTTNTQVDSPSSTATDPSPVLNVRDSIVNTLPQLNGVTVP